jgi:hypothetical protein
MPATSLRTPRNPAGSGHQVKTVGKRDPGQDAKTNQQIPTGETTDVEGTGPKREKDENPQKPARDTTDQPDGEKAA